MMISKIDMCNHYRTNSTSFKRLMSDDEAIKTFDKFMTKNDLFLRSDIDSEYGSPYRVTLYTTEPNINFINKKVTVPLIGKDKRSGKFYEVSARGKTFNEAKYSLMSYYCEKPENRRVFTLSGQKELEMPDIELY